MTKTISGIAASDGIAAAKAYLLVQPDLSFEKKMVSDVDGEVAKLKSALEVSDSELSTIRDKAVESLGEEEAQVFDAHKMILADPEFTGAVEQKIKDDSVSAEQALDEVSKQFITLFESMVDNPYMQERAADVRDVSKRVMSHLLGVTLPNPALIDEEVIIVAEDLTPSDTAQLNKKYVKGFVTDIGGRTAHSAIMARSLEIPAIVGTNVVTKEVIEGQSVIIDGNDGDFILDPSDADLVKYNKMAADFAAQKAEWEKLKNEETRTADGKQFDIAANIGTPKDLDGVLANGAEGIGLYRTEFLYMDSAELPDEDSQFEAYKTVLEGMNGKPVVVRTMDIGGDKHLPYMPLPDEMNPFLGYRAIRISLDKQDIFRTQLRALLRASVYGSLRIMFPMIATIQEFNDAKAIFEEEKKNLIAEGTKVSDNIQVGMMIEIPAAAILADQFAKVVDFFSIGTNDLIQYTMAADRGNEHVSYLYQPYNPSILRLVKNVIEASHKEGKWTGMCGEAAGDPIMVPLLLGMGLDEFSMSATSVLKVRSLMKKLDTTKLVDLVDQAVNVSLTNDDNEKLVTDYMNKI
ncbi:phosphoenolpyruvate-protein phosphotransferase [Companilactobacillus sp. RD055328]|uniref:phosphoenolpyruvate--protein phosphotransferase n=1 Tax=Companilactobacillus sp. RD055328 TaxID=2916634 RepID=UPI001FC8C1C9|nr:phosphoenolpyruvate--protein phosphotransferase [Companilactobacillus sp. RD055328]GKQ43093.1 phosphoenolpyruvate-protein phosphotransferase [Companilactobacillus sp. RD055328]